MEDIIGRSLLDEFFDKDTMSVHFKQDVHILRKKGRPGNWDSEILAQTPNKEYLFDFMQKLYDETSGREDAFLEIDKTYSKVLQLGPYRIVIVLPPLSDGIEITVVKPIKKLKISDYKLDEKILNLLQTKSNGILISGGPGQGKTTFAQALVEMYVDMKKIVKTVESPRDLLVPNEVTQYSFSYAPHSEIRDILLLSRPDYTVYDEVRNTEDFLLFKDLRLTGIGLVGIIHATNPIDSIQRFIGTIQMGVIPQVVDTIIYIEGGKILEIFTLEQVVKMPEGMNSDDLSRPVILVKSFLDELPKYEIYTYGEQVVVMPLDKIQNVASSPKSKMMEFAQKHLEEKLSDYYGFNVAVQAEGQAGIKVFCEEKHKGSIIGKGGENIQQVEKMLGLSISVKTLDELKTQDDVEINIENNRKGKKDYMTIKLPKEYANKNLRFLIGGEILKFTTDSRSEIQFKTGSYTKKIEKNGIKLI